MSLAVELTILVGSILLSSSGAWAEGYWQGYRKRAKKAAKVKESQTQTEARTWTPKLETRSGYVYNSTTKDHKEGDKCEVVCALAYRKGDRDSYLSSSSVRVMWKDVRDDDLEDWMVKAVVAAEAKCAVLNAMDVQG